MDATGPSVLNGIDLLMNPRKRQGSDASSVASSGSKGSDRQRNGNGGSDRGSRHGSSDRGSRRQGGGVDAPMQQRSGVPPPMRAEPAVVSLGSGGQTSGFGSGGGFGSGYGAAAAAGGGGVFGASSFRKVPEDDDDDEVLEDEDDEGDVGDDDDEGGDDGEGSDEGGSSIVQHAGHASRYSHLTAEEVMRKKRETLYELARIERKGVTLPRRFTMDDSLDEMRSELDRIKLDRELDVSVRFQRKMLVTCVTGIELLNGKFDPFDVKLDGWSDSMHENMGDYDEVFEDLHMKYRSKAKMAPELKLMFMVAGSGVMFHLTNSMFRQSSAAIPGFEQVMRNNPQLAHQYAQAAHATMAGQGGYGMPQQQQQPRGGGGLFGGLSGLFGGLFGGGGGPAQQQQQQQQQTYASPAPTGQAPQQAPQQAPAPAMRGPKPVNDVLRELHRSAFQPATPARSPSPPPMPMNTRPFSDSNRIEIISNASDTDTNISELADIVMPSSPSPTAQAAPASFAAAAAEKKKRASGVRRKVPKAAA